MIVFFLKQVGKTLQDRQFCSQTRQLFYVSVIYQFSHIISQFGTLPLGVTAVSQKVLTAFETSEVTKTFFHGHSFTANPIACAAGNASFDLLLADSCQQNIREITEHHKNFANEIRSISVVRDVRTLGTIIAIVLKSDESTSYTNSLRKHIYSYFLERDILLRPLGNTFYIIAPYCITQQELEKIYSTIRQFLKSLLNDQ